MATKKQPCGHPFALVNRVTDFRKMMYIDCNLIIADM